MPAKPVTVDALDEYERKVLAAFEEGYQALVVVVPGMTGMNGFSAGLALADLKRKKLVAFEGRGKTKSVYLTDAGEALRKQLAGEAAKPA